jgi:glycine cleavage system aminomethyltransferase T
MHADRVVQDGREVGVSSGNIYSYHIRESLSLDCIDAEFRAPGTELIVDWGDNGKRIKPCRVTVAQFPCNQEGRNSEI